MAASLHNRVPRTPRSLPSLSHVRRLRGSGRRCGSSSSNRRNHRDHVPVVCIDDDGSWREVNRDTNGSTSSTNTSNGMIDLTASGDEEYIDLTSPNGLRENRMPIVLGQANGIPGHRGRSGRHHRTNSRRNNETHSVAVIESVDNNNDNDDIEELPDLDEPVFPDPGLNSDSYQPEANTSLNTSVTSPDLKTMDCPICMDNSREIRRSKRQLATTTCGHIFCKPCIRRAVQSQHACPTCRKKLTLKQIIPLFI